jgi:hypothetical protein
MAPVLADLAGHASHVPQVAAELATNGLLAELLQHVTAGGLETQQVGIHECCQPARYNRVVPHPVSCAVL